MSKTIRCLLAILLPATTPLCAQQTYPGLGDALRTGFVLLRGKSGPDDVNWILGGAQYSFKENADIHTFDPKTLQEKTVFTAAGLTFPGTTKPFAYESFQWSRDSKHLVFRTNLRRIYRNSGISDYYIYDVDTRQLRLAAKDARSAELSPDGGSVGIEREGNLFVYPFASGAEKQLTADHTADTGIFNGHYDWVYEEEFGQGQAWNWSKDSRYIAFWQFDERPVPVFEMMNFSGFHSEPVRIPIPQPGDANPLVRIGVADVQTGKRVWLSPDETGDYYIPRVYWTSNPDELAVMTLNRAQNHMKLYFFNVRTGDRRVVLEEQNSTWISIFDFYTGVNDMVYFPEKSKEFFWVSDRSGYYHVYRYGYDGKLINAVTTGKWDLIKVTGIDPDSKTIYYLSAETSPLEQQLYSIRYDGSAKKRLTQSPGFHDIDMSTNTAYYIDRYSNIRTPQQVELCDARGQRLKLLEDNHEVGEFTSAHFYSPKVLFRFRTSDGTDLDAYMIKPMNFDSTRKYPVVLTIYGGPESHAVYNSFESDGWQQWLAQQGYISVDINNRGISNYGSKFMKVVYRQLGKWESQDFTDAAAYLGSLPYVDKDRIGIMGESYGGYATTYTVLTHPDVFKVAIANSPVTDWRLYDDIYTERYMGLPADNADGYRNSSDMTHAANLHAHLLLIHSMLDDNVHPANTMQLLTALTDAGKDADLRIYPPGAHGAAYSWESWILLNQVSFEYLERYLKK
ncbi:MAG TPA: S9 family peptidase [Puia sp.]|nr:S9 family peptidase [Puia sp.]